MPSVLGLGSVRDVFLTYPTGSGATAADIEIATGLSTATGCTEWNSDVMGAILPKSAARPAAMDEGEVPLKGKFQPLKAVWLNTCKTIR